MTTGAAISRNRRPPHNVPVLSTFGRLVIALVSFIGGLVILLGSTLSGIVTAITDCRIGAVERRVALMDLREIMRQMQVVSWGTLAIALVTVTSSGMVIAMETVEQLRSFGMASAYLGGGVAYACMREMAPVPTAVTATASVASSITAQLASMKVTEQIDAIRSMGVNPIRFLVMPRFIALVVMIPVLTVLADYCGIAGGFVIARAHEIAFATYRDSIYMVVSPSTFYGGLIKAFVFAVFISLTACLMGLRSQGGAAGVGKATISSVVTCIILIYLWDTILTATIWRNG